MVEGMVEDEWRRFIMDRWRSDIADEKLEEECILKPGSERLGKLKSEAKRKWQAMGRSWEAWHVINKRAEADKRRALRRLRRADQS